MVGTPWPRGSGQMMIEALRAVQSHVIERASSLRLPATAKELQARLRKGLVEASNEGLLTTSHQEILKALRLADPPSSVAADLKKAGKGAGAKCIFGGEKNQGRDPARPHFTRRDGAWFDFAITVRDGGSQLELLAYDFEIRLPVRSGVPFARFDLNLPAHANEEREIRCHVHPGT